MSPQKKELYEFGPYELDASRRLLRRDEEVLPLTSKGLETLLVLVRNRDRVLMKDELMKALWPDSFVEEVNLAQNVSALRKVLGETPGENRFIATIPGKGYRFVCDVKEGGSADGIRLEQPPQGLFAQAKEGESPLTLRPPIPGRSKWAVSKLGAGLALGLCLIALAVFFSMVKRGPTAAKAADRSLAILPFQSLAPATDDQHLGLGVADAVITKLSNIRQLPVRPTDVVIRYAEPGVDPMRAAREMGVDSVLSGKIQKSGDRLRVTVQLVRVQDGRPLWAQTFDENYTNVFAVEDSISEKVVQALAVKLAAQEKERLDRHYTENIEAYRNYLEGRYAEFTFTRDGMNRAIAFFDRAIADDPSYSLAYAGLADAYTTESDWLLSPREALPRAEAAARKALAFDDNLAEAHEALAHALLHEWRLTEADQEFHRALLMNPSSVSTYYTYAEYLASTGHVDQAIGQMQRALTIDPLSPEINSFLAWDYYLKRDYSGCLATSHKAMQTFPSLWVPHLIAGMCYSMQSKLPEAIQEYLTARKMNPESTFAEAGLGICYARSGARNEAYRTMRALKGMAARTYVSPAYIGLIYSALGERDREFEWYAKAYDDRAEWLLWLPSDPLFDSARSDPRFRDLVRRVGAMPSS